MRCVATLAAASFAIWSTAAFADATFVPADESRGWSSQDKTCYGYWQCAEPFDALTLSWQAIAKHQLAARVLPTGTDTTSKLRLYLTNGTAKLGPFIQALANRFSRDHADPLKILLIGEMHDNAEHHKFQALMTRAVGAYRNPTALVFEQFTSAQQASLDRFAELQATDAAVATLDALKRAVEWDKGGWAKYNYDALLQAAIDGKHPLYAGDVPRDAMMKAAKEGSSALPADERTRLGLDTLLGPKLDDESLAEIEASHCGMMPKASLGGMAFAQRYRDAHLADVALTAAAKHGSAILISGNGHVRTDRAVPWYIRQRAPDKKVVSVMLVEVEDGHNDPESYVPLDPDGKPAADYIVFTPRAERGDPCEGMKAKKAG